MSSCASSRVSMAAVASDARNCGPIHFTGYALVKFQCMSSTPAASYITIDTLRRLNLPLAIAAHHLDRKSTRLNSSHANISYAVFCLKKKKKIDYKNL